MCRNASRIRAANGATGFGLLAAVLERVARVAEEVPELVELDLNPILVGPAGATVVDCKARLAPRPPGPGPLFPALRRRTRA